LRQFLGYDAVPANYDVVGDLAYQPLKGNLEDLQAKALRERPDFQAALLGVTAAQRQIQLAKANSEDPSKVLDGDLRALTAVELTSRYGQEVSQAAQALKNPGDLSGLVRAKAGVHILKLRLHTPQLLQALAEVKGQIRTRLQNEHRNQAYEKFIADLKAKAGLTVDEAALAKVVVEVTPRPEGAPGLRTMLPSPTPVAAPAPTPALTPVPTPPAQK